MTPGPAPVREGFSTDTQGNFRLTPFYLITGFLSWAVPGAGHWLLGYRVRGVVIGATILATFWFGETVLGENLAVTKRVHPIFYYLQVGSGFSPILADAVWGDPFHEKEENIAEIAGGAGHLPALPRHLNLAILLTSLAGLLNVLVVLHVFDPRTWEARARGEDEIPSSGTPPPDVDAPVSASSAAEAT